MADPDNARLLGLLAYWLASDYLNSWNGAGQAEVDRAEAAARKAISLDPTLAIAHHALGWVYRIRGDHKASLAAFKKAIKSDPNFAVSYAQAANEMVFLGDAKGAIPMAKKAIELSPKDKSVHVFGYVLGRAYFAVGDYEKAAETLGESVRARDNLWFAHLYWAAALALCNKDAEAKQVLERYKKVHSKFPDIASVQQYYAQPRFQDPGAKAAVTQMLAGLKKAGMQ